MKPKGKEFWLVLYEKGPKRDQDEKTAEEIQAAHMKHLFALRDAGRLLFFGPVLDEVDLRGICFYDGGLDRKEIESFAAEDPAVVVGRLRFSVHRWFGTGPLINF